MRSRHATTFVSALAVGVALSGCGGGGADDGADDGAPADPGAVAEAPQENEAAGVVELGEPSLTADPGTAWAEVDGERFTYESAGSLAFACDIGPDRVQVNFQTSEGRDLLLQAVRQGDAWTGQLTFQPGGGQNLQYSASLPAAADPLVIGEEALGFEGTATRIEDFDAAGADEVEAAVAVNCALAAGEQPSAVVDGTTYTFSPSGAQSFDCSVTAENLEVRINRLARDGLQLEVSARQEGDQWVGAVVVITPEATFTSTLPPDGSGLTVGGASVDYEGTFTGGPGGDVAGTVSVTCP